MRNRFVGNMSWGLSRNLGGVGLTAYLSIVALLSISCSEKLDVPPPVVESIDPPTQFVENSVNVSIFGQNFFTRIERQLDNAEKFLQNEEFVVLLHDATRTDREPFRLAGVKYVSSQILIGSVPAQMPVGTYNVQVLTPLRQASDATVTFTVVENPNDTLRDDGGVDSDTNGRRDTDIDIDTVSDSSTETDGVTDNAPETDTDDIRDSGRDTDSESGSESDETSDSDVDSVTGGDEGTESETDTSSDSERDTITDTGTYTDLDADTETEMLTDVDVSTDTTTDPVIDTVTDTDVSDDTVSNTDIVTDSETASESETETATETETESGTGTEDTEVPTDTEVATDTFIIPDGEEVAFRPSSGMVIDGVLDETDWEPTTLIQQLVRGTVDDVIEFDLLWDAQYLYIGVAVHDDVLRNDAGDFWDDDMVDVAIDGGHEQSASLDENDAHCLAGYDDDNLYCEYEDYAPHQGGIIHAWQEMPEGGYSVEIAMPWSHLGVVPYDGMMIGFDIGVRDDDGGGNDNLRDNQLRWHDNSDQWWDPILYGEVTLMDRMAP